MKRAVDSWEVGFRAVLAAFLAGMIAALMITGG
jgi:hypothetical protein